MNKNEEFLKRLKDLLIEYKSTIHYTIDERLVIEQGVDEKEIFSINSAWLEANDLP